MPDKYFMSAGGADFAGSLTDSLHNERILWTGRCAVAEYAFDEPASLPRWTLPEETEVVVTDQRVVYRDSETGHTGDLRWPWPQHLRVQPGNRDTGRTATVTQIQLVCNGPDETFPALVFAGGDVTTVGDADRLANVLRQSIARYRVENAADLGLTAAQARMLSRLVIGPEFNNYLGGEGQTVSLLGAIAVGRPTAIYRSAELRPAPAPVPAPRAPEPAPAMPAAAVGWAVGERSGLSANAAQSPQMPRTDPADLETRAADLAARVASLVSGGIDLNRYEAETTNLSAFLDLPPAVDGPPYGTPSSNWDPEADRAEAARRTAARFAGNSARARGAATHRQGEDEFGTPRTQYR
ncbi:MAG: translation initiation factor 2 [Actinoplanes sp.]